MKSASSPIRIAITQRVVFLKDRAERRDALDQAWSDFLARCGMEPVLIPNRHPDPVGFIRRMQVRGIVLSGGNNPPGAFDGYAGGDPDRDLALDIAPERDRLETLLIRDSMKTNRPVLGVCRGMQMLNLIHGGRLRPVPDHAGCRHGITPEADAAGWWPAGLEKSVNSFHGFGMTQADVAGEMKPIASWQGTVECIVHRAHLHFGIMWHPEREKDPAASDIRLFKTIFGRNEGKPC